MLAGGLTLAALAQPLVVVSAREAVRAVPQWVRWSAYGLGATRWQVVRMQVLPAALPQILAGACIALSRVVGEAAPLLVIGAAAFVAFVPGGPLDPLASLPTQIYAWTARSQEGFAALAGGAILALFLLLLLLHGGGLFP